MKNLKYKAALFDLDGTLLDTLGSIRMYLNSVLSEWKIKNITEEQTRLFVGDGARVLMRRALENDGGPLASSLLDGDFSEITKNYVDRYNDNPYPKTRLYPGIYKALSALSDAGIRLAVISNKPDKTVNQLVEYFFPGMFDIVLGQREGAPLKPSPAVPLDICTALGVSPAETAYFGDTGVDMKTARAYGAGLICGVLWGFRDEEELLEFGADITIKEPIKIPALFFNN